MDTILVNSSLIAARRLKHAAWLFVMILVLSCSRQDQPDTSFVDQVVDLTIETSTGQNVQLPDLYDGLVNEIPDDANEKVFLVEKLKRKGFKVTNWGRGNFPLGPRVITIELMNDICICEVTKAYYSSGRDTLYQIVEGLKCKRNTVDG